MGDHGNVCNYDKATKFSSTNESEIKGGKGSSSQKACKINASNSRQFANRSNKKMRHSHENHKQKEEATHSYFIPTKPREFIGFYVCKEYSGARILGTVRSHCRKYNLLKVEYDDYTTEYLQQDDVLKLAATKRDIVEAREVELAAAESDIVEAHQALLKSKNSKNTPHDGAERPAPGEGSTATKRKGNIHGK